MSRPVKPVVSQEAVPLPFWARDAMWSEKEWLSFPDCLLVARVRYPQLSLYLIPKIFLVPKQWLLVSFTVDGIECERLVPGADPRVTVAIGLEGLHHVFGIEPEGEQGVIEPVRLKLRRGTIVLVEVWPETRRLAGGRSPAVKYRILPAGLTRNGRWGERWARRLGWADGQ